MKKLIAATLVIFALASPALAFDIGGIDGIPSDVKDVVSKNSGGRVTNKQAGQQGGKQAQGGQQQDRRKARQARKSQGQGQGMQAKGMQGAEQMMGGEGGGPESMAGSFMNR